MSKINDGGPAFPVQDDERLIGGYGMSLRDWFAGQAISQLSETNPNLPGDRAKTWPEPEELAERRAKWAYLQADAMLAAREADNA